MFAVARNPLSTWKLLEELNRESVRRGETWACFTHEELKRHLHPKRRRDADYRKHPTAPTTRPGDVRTRCRQAELSSLIIFLTSSREALSASSASRRRVRSASTCALSSLIWDRRASLS